MTATMTASEDAKAICRHCEGLRKDRITAKTAARVERLCSLLDQGKLRREDKGQL